MQFSPVEMEQTTTGRRWPADAADGRQRPVEERVTSSGYERGRATRKSQTP
jgi:hypothetical protein